ncbi:MAG: rod shape-determining protein RodA [Clostridia bacterium]|nr:rod shape-determining protein RodA [Clostridia bacterium]
MRYFFHGIREYFRETDRLLWISCLLSSVFSCMLVYSAVHRTNPRSFYMQCIAIALGYAGAVLVSLIDYHRLSKMWPLIAAGGLGLMALTSVMGITVAGTDDTAWIVIGGVSFQPSELVKIGFLVTLATHLEGLRIHRKMRSFGHICLLLMHALIPMAIIHIQGDDGAALVFFFIFLTMCFCAGVQLRYFLLVIAGVAAAVPLAWNFVLNNDQKKRFEILFDHTLDPLGYGYQQGQSEISIGSGQLFGQGWLQGPRVQASLVPEDHNDFIFSVAGEEFGFAGCMAILLLLTLMMAAVLLIGIRASDPLGRNICGGFLGLLAFQSIANIGMCLYVFPVIGITLPFFSAGGSSAACLYLGIGLVQGVCRHRKRQTAMIRYG